MVHRVRFAFLILTSLFTLLAGAQTQEIQSMEEKHADEVELYDLVNKSNRLTSVDPNLALTTIEEALRISYRIKDKRGEAFCYQTLGVIQHEKNNEVEAIGYYKKAKSLFKDTDQKAFYTTVRFLAQAFEADSQYRKAEKEYREYLDLARQKGSSSDEIFAKESIARVLFNRGRYQEANGMYKQLLVAYRAAGDSIKASNTYEFIGKCYAAQKDTTQALRYFGKAGSLTDKITSPLAQRNSWQTVSRSYNSMGEYDKSVEYEKRAKKFNVKNRDYQSVYSNNTNIANDYLVLNQASEAIPFLEENIDLASEMGELQNTGETYRSLSEAYAKLGKLEEAKKSFDQYKDIQEKILDEREQEINARSEEASTFVDKEKQIELLIKDRELDEKRIQLLESGKQQEARNHAQQRRISYLMGGLVLLLLVVVAFFYRSSKQKQLANKLLSIRSLRSQMNPHFIFNSLNSVNSFISKSDERSANKYLTEFARLMRTVLEHSKQDFVVLSAEIEVLKRYLRLEHIRFHDQFDYEFEVDDELDLERLLIPPMLVQPYIENAIWHGLRYKKDKGRLSVHFTASEDGIEVLVIDDGIGREQSKALKTRNQKAGKSTGISNTAARLKLLNEVHDIQITSELEDLQSDGSGTRVRIEIPRIDVDEKKYAETT